MQGANGYMARGAYAQPGAERSLRAWSAEAKRRLAASIDAAHAAWAAAWGLEAAALPPARCRDAFGVGAEELRGLSGSWQVAGPGLWWAYAPAFGGGDSAEGHLAALEQALFGSPERPEPASGVARTDLCRSVCLDAWGDFLARLEAAAFLGAPAPAAEPAAALPGPAWSPWSGTLLVELAFAGDTLRIAAAAERVERVPSSPPVAPPAPLRPTSVWRAAARTRVWLSVETGPFQVDVGALAGLRVGDVLRTGHPLEAPLTVRMVDGAREEGSVCAAWLGRSGAWRAAGLRAPDAEAEPARRPGTDPVTQPHLPLPSAAQPAARIP